MINRLIKLAFLSIFAMFPNVAMSEVRNGHMVGNWYLAELHSSALPYPYCIATRTFSDGTAMNLTLYHTGGMQFSLENQDWISLNQLQENGAHGEVIFPGSITFVEHEFQWHGNFIVNRQSRYNPKPKIYMRVEDGILADFILAIGRSRSISVLQGDRQIGEYDMAGSLAAMGELVGCAQSVGRELDRQRSNDPFRQR